MDKVMNGIMERVQHLDLKALVPTLQRFAADNWAFLAPAGGYLLLVAALRNRRLHQMQKEFGYTTRESFAKMTDDDAWGILKKMGALEFPFINLKALQFALFRTYGIPTISKLLVKTSEFSSASTAMKRYADTSVLIAEFMLHSPSSRRGYDAIARMNYLHSGYRASGKILDDDMLYTLSLFALEPYRYVNRYEWRQVSEMEKCAMGTYWKSLGDAMQISYEKLPGSKTGFKDGVQWFDEIDTWSQAYEKECMVPHEANRKTADETVNLLLWDVPRIFHPLGRSMVSYLMDDRLRKSMKYDEPGWLASGAYSSVLEIRKLALRYLALPRPSFMRFRRLTEDPDEKGPHTVLAYEGAPYYVKPTIWNRWGPGAWVSRLMGSPVPGDGGDIYFPEGFYTEDVGPKSFVGKGQKYLDQTKERLQHERTGGTCPFAVAK